MADILFFCAGLPLSDFRLKGLQQPHQSEVPGACIASAEFWHVVKLNAALDAAGRQQLAALLEERTGGDEAGGSLVILVTPRIGAISPWSSKATDIALNCGLAAVERIERVMAYRVAATPGVLSAAQQTQITALLHDRMIEAVPE